MLCSAGGCLHSGRACANHGVHYVDLAGEPHFIKTIIQKFVNRSRSPVSFSTGSLSERYDYQAYKNNAILIPCCGFDSVPADVVVYLANKTAKSALGPSAYIEDSLSLYRLKGGFSGGTLASVISSIEDVPKALTTEAMKDFSYRERERVPLPYSSSTVHHLHSEGGSHQACKTNLHRSCRREDLVWRDFPYVSHQPTRCAPHLVALHAVPGSAPREGLRQSFRV